MRTRYMHMDGPSPSRAKLGADDRRSAVHLR